MASIILCCGFTVVTEELIENREKLCDRIRSRYTEKALTSFVNEVRKEYAIFEGVAIAESEVKDDCITLDWNPFRHMVSGDWAMKVVEEKKLFRTKIDHFQFLWAYGENAGILISGHRGKSGELILDEIVREEIVHINWR